MVYLNLYHNLGIVLNALANNHILLFKYLFSVYIYFFKCNIILKNIFSEKFFKKLLTILFFCIKMNA